MSSPEDAALAYAALQEALRHDGVLRTESVVIQAPLARFLAGLAAARAATPAPLDVDALAEAWANVMDGRRIGEGLADNEVARLFHEAYERLAPDFGYRTREASAKRWADVPATNKALMTATVHEVRAALQASVPQVPEDNDALYLAAAAEHLVSHLATERPAFYCEDLDNVQHFAAKVLAREAPSEAPR